MITDLSGRGLGCHRRNTFITRMEEVGYFERERNYFPHSPDPTAPARYCSGISHYVVPVQRSPGYQGAAGSGRKERRQMINIREDAPDNQTVRSVEGFGFIA